MPRVRAGVTGGTVGYAVLAGLVAGVHLLFVVFVILGGVLALRWKWIPVVHVPAAIYGALIEWTGGICPLTPLENRLRVAAGAAAYEGDFVDSYLLTLLYPDALTTDTQTLLAAAVVVVNAIVYTAVWRRSRR